jgi:hypothetical protein
MQSLQDSKGWSLKVAPFSEPRKKSGLSATGARTIPPGTATLGATISWTPWHPALRGVASPVFLYLKAASPLRRGYSPVGTVIGHAVDGKPGEICTVHVYD